MIEVLELYTKAQKTVGSQFIIIGVCLLIIAGITWFGLPTTEFHNGLKVSSLTCGLLISIGGLVYFNFSQTTHDKIVKIHQESETKFIQTEQIRMTKVLKDYPIYQIVFATFIVIALLLIFVVNQPFWIGVACPIIGLFVGVLIVEYISKTSIDNYFLFLSKL
ncbi:MAG: hypothetical protein AB8G11_14235 [Saprospiraceae bacterium]